MKNEKKDIKINLQIWIPIIISLIFSFGSLYVSLMNAEYTKEQIKLSEKNYELSKGSNDLDVCSKKYDRFYQLVENCNTTLSIKSSLKENLKNNFIECIKSDSNQTNYDNISNYLLNTSCYQEQPAQPEQPQQYIAVQYNIVLILTIIILLLGFVIYFKKGKKKDINGK